MSFSGGSGHALKCYVRPTNGSTANIPKSFCEELDISVLPLTILAGENEYRDGVEITPAEFYKIIDASKKLPVSSQVASVLYSELFEETYFTRNTRRRKYNNISDSVSKIIARRKDTDHGDMLPYADGYMTAWFMYWLKADNEAGNVFFGEEAEIISNSNWQEVKKNH